MKMSSIKTYSVLILVLIIAFLQYYSKNRNCFLMQYSTSQEIEKISYIEITKYPNSGVAETLYYTDRKMIVNIMKNLNSIPLVYEKNDDAMVQNPATNVEIHPYNKDGIEMGWIMIDDKYIRRSLDEKLFKLKNEEDNILVRLEEFEYQSKGRKERPIERREKVVTNEDGSVEVYIEIKRISEDGSVEVETQKRR